MNIHHMHVWDPFLSDLSCKNSLIHCIAHSGLQNYLSYCLLILKTYKATLIDVAYSFWGSELFKYTCLLHERWNSGILGAVEYFECTTRCFRHLYGWNGKLPGSNAFSSSFSSYYLSLGYPIPYQWLGKQDGMAEFSSGKEDLITKLGRASSLFLQILSQSL